MSCSTITLKSQVKLLAIGDPHFKVDNIEESEHFYHQVEQYLLHHPVDYIIILGDILHSHEKIYTFALNMAVKFIMMCSQFAHVYCIVGNHDATSNTIFCSSNHWMNVFTGIPKVTVVEKPVIVGLNNQDQSSLFICCPYVSDGRFMEMLNKYAGGCYTSTCCIFAHQLFNGGKMGAIVATDVEEWVKEHPLLISGHLHDRQTPQDNLHYTGSSQQLAFSESSDKSLCVVTLSPNEEVKATYEEVYLDLKQRKTLYSTIDEVDSLEFKDNVQYKIVIRDEETKIKAFKKTIKYKQLQQIENVRSVQFKAIDKDTKMKEDDEESTSSCDFLSKLQQRIQVENAYVKSYAAHLLSGSEDLSDKDVLLL